MRCLKKTSKQEAKVLGFSFAFYITTVSNQIDQVKLTPYKDDKGDDSKT